MSSLFYNKKVKRWELWVGTKMVDKGEISVLYASDPKNVRYHGPDWKPKDEVPK